MRNKWKADSYDNETIPFKIAKVAVPILSIPPAFIFFLRNNLTTPLPRQAGRGVVLLFRLFTTCNHP